MRKITLSLDHLAVESFETATVDGDRGTVQAHFAPTYNGADCGSAYDACPTGLCAPTSTPRNC